MGKKESSGFDRMSKHADSDDVFDDTFTLKKSKKKKKDDKKEKE